MCICVYVFKGVEKWGKLQALNFQKASWRWGRMRGHQRCTTARLPLSRLGLVQETRGSTRFCSCQGFISSDLKLLWRFVALRFMLFSILWSICTLGLLLRENHWGRLSVSRSTRSTCKISTVHKTKRPGARTTLKGEKSPSTGRGGDLWRTGWNAGRHLLEVEWRSQGVTWRITPVESWCFLLWEGGSFPAVVWEDVNSSALVLLSVTFITHQNMPTGEQWEAALLARGSWSCLGSNHPWEARYAQLLEVVHWPKPGFVLPEVTSANCAVSDKAVLYPQWRRDKMKNLLPLEPVLKSGRLKEGKKETVVKAGEGL